MEPTLSNTRDSNAWKNGDFLEARPLLGSNVARAEWPYGSGRWITFPEVDRYLWCDPQTAREKLNPAQAEFMDRLVALLGFAGFAQKVHPAQKLGGLHKK